MSIAAYIRQFIDASFNEIDLPFPTYKQKGEGGTVLCAFGEIEDKIYFLKSGLIQVNILNGNADIRIVDFFFPESFFCAYTSFLTTQPSDVEIVSMTDFEVEIVYKADLLKSYETSLIANKLGRMETEKLYLKKVKREKDLLTKTAEACYLDLIEENSAILKHVNIDKLAKYLGIHPESLSRIRRKKMKGN